MLSNLNFEYSDNRQSGTNMMCMKFYFTELLFLLFKCEVSVNHNPKYIQDKKTFSIALFLHHSFSNIIPWLLGISLAFHSILSF